jgi:two-component system response regulator MprA
MSPQALVLIVDDDPELRKFLAGELAAEGYGVETAGTGQQALTRIREGGLDLVVLDWTLPDFSGVEVCRRMRGTGVGTAVLMLTARDDVRERVEALDAGADDYLTKPFSIEELLARVRARLRRHGAAGAGGAGGEARAEVLRLGGLEMNLATREVRRDGEAVTLTPREFSLLETLLRHANRVMVRTELLEAVWGPNFVGDANVLDVYIRYLRRKLERSDLPTLIHTVRGVGFMMREEGEQDPR